jgi:REP element-mobilizing transposase RayT
MDKSLFQQKRKSHIEKGEIYFWTATINQWQRLLENDEYKGVVIDSLQYLTDSGKIDVFAFIIMPNHIHLIWRVNEPNGKESPQGSLLKYTAHQFKTKLRAEDREKLELYKVNSSTKDYEFWQRDSLAVPIFTREVAFQKLKYIHNNPLAEHWQLVKHPCEYKYSSARYYELNEKNFTFLKDLWEEI